MPPTAVLLAVIAQVTSSSTDPSLERIRRQLAEPPPRLTVTTDAIDVTRPTFRLSINATRPLFLTSPWEPNPAVAPYVRPAYPLYHYEYLFMTTPEEFRASTLYPGSSTYPGIDLLALIRGTHGDRAKRREALERRAREQVRKELEAYKASLPKP